MSNIESVMRMNNMHNKASIIKLSVYSIITTVHNAKIWEW